MLEGNEHTMEYPTVVPPGAANELVGAKLAEEAWAPASQRRAEIDVTEMEKAAKAIQDCSDIKSVRAILAWRSKAEREEIGNQFQQQNGVSLEKFFTRKFSGAEKDEALRLLERRDGDADAALIKLALDEKDLGMFREAMLAASEQSRKSVRSEGGKQRLAEVFDDFELVMATDYLVDGQASTANKIRSNSHWYNDSEDNIADVLSHMSEAERRHYANGKALAEDPVVPKLSDADKVIAEQTYRSIRAALEEVGNSSEAAAWEDQIMHNGNVSTANKIRQNSGWLNDREAEIMSAIDRMSDDERKQYLDGRALFAGSAVPGLSPEAQRAALDTYSGIHSALTEAGRAGEVEEWEQRIMDQRGNPVLELIRMLEVLNEKPDGNKAQMLCAVMDAIEANPALSVLLRAPDSDEEIKWARRFRETWLDVLDKTEFGEGSFIDLGREAEDRFFDDYAKPLLEDGRLNWRMRLDVRKQAEGAYGVFTEIAKLAGKTDDRSVSEKEVLRREIKFVLRSQAEQDLALKLLDQGEMRPEDRIRARIIACQSTMGVGRQELLDELRRVEDIAAIRKAYADKYGDLSTQLWDQLGAGHHWREAEKLLQERQLLDTGEFRTNAMR